MSVNKDKQNAMLILDMCRCHMIKWLARITLSWRAFDIIWNMASENLSTDSEGSDFQVLEGVVYYVDPTTSSNAMNAFVVDWQQRACRYSLSRKHCSLQAFVRHVVEHAGLREWTEYCTVCVISLFINDMQDDPVCTLRLFADDALLYHKITHNDDTLALQHDLDKLGLWADRWQMLFNPFKCYKMSVFRSRSPVVKDYTLYNQTLVAVQQHPYLGVLLSSDLRWNSHVDKIAKKGNSSLAFVKRNLYACSEETKRAAYVSLVRPHLEYATAVWDTSRQNQVEKLEAIQSRAVRFIKHDYSYNTSISKFKKSLSFGLLSERRKSHRLQIFHKSVYNDIALPIPPYYQL